MNSYVMACQMLGLHKGTDLPVGLEARLYAVEMLVKRVKPGCSLESSQVVAMIVEQWKRDTAPQQGAKEPTSVHVFTPSSISSMVSEVG